MDFFGFDDGVEDHEVGWGDHDPQQSSADIPEFDNLLPVPRSAHFEVFFDTKVYRTLLAAEQFFGLPNALQRRATQIFHDWRTAARNRNIALMCGLAFLHAAAENRGGRVIFIGDVIRFAKLIASHEAKPSLPPPAAADAAIPQTNREAAEAPSLEEFLEFILDPGEKNPPDESEEPRKSANWTEYLSYEKILKMYHSVTASAGYPMLLFHVESAAMQILNEYTKDKEEAEKTPPKNKKNPAELTSPEAQLGSGRVAVTLGAGGGGGGGGSLRELSVEEEWTIASKAVEFFGNLNLGFPDKALGRTGRATRFEAALGGCVALAMRQRGVREWSREKMGEAVRLEKGTGSNSVYVWMKKAEKNERLVLEKPPPKRVRTKNPATTRRSTPKKKQKVEEEQQAGLVVHSVEDLLESNSFIQ